MTSTSARDIALGNEILRGVVGSSAHGTAIEGQDDRDEMAVFVEPSENVCGLEACDHYVHRDRPEGVRSGPGDLDLVMYSLRRFCRLAAQGNPSVFLLLWLPSYVNATEIGEGLVGFATPLSAAPRASGSSATWQLKRRDLPANAV